MEEHIKHSQGAKENDFCTNPFGVDEGGVRENWAWIRNWGEGFTTVYVEPFFILVMTFLSEQFFKSKKEYSLNTKSILWCWQVSSSKLWANEFPDILLSAPKFGDYARHKSKTGQT